ncbi:MAG: endonuclease/exonuclease/phosphatase family protein [Tannerellaceae bacterium]|jgi:endonuclease/exonuclease/phosphatase family metal-dependent hydrolase|nr:endonuclease/exonuclease/phosphatase family protein [Tannerellaceae bacterium]
MKNLLIIALALSSTFLSCTGSRTALELKVATYNLRMDTPSDSANAWPYRKEAVKALIQYHDFDIVGTQEGFLHQLQGVCELQAYTYSGSGRDDGKEAGEHSAILYKKDKFTMLDSGDFWLRETPDTPGLGWDATCCNRICSWVKFKELKSGAEFYFFNVHFDHQGVVARKESGKLMIRKIKEIAQDAPVILTGDFNSTPETEQIQALSAFLHDARSISAQQPYGPEGTFNRRFSHPIGKNRIDYIFVSDAFRVKQYAVLTDYREFPYFPSDHQPVSITLFKP